MTRAFWLLAAVIALPMVAWSTIRAVFRRPRKRDLRVVGLRTCSAPGCPECRAWREAVSR